MRNKYPGPCYRCSGIVSAGEGHFQKAPGGWVVQHADCAIRHRSATTAARKARKIRPEPDAPVLREIRS